MLVNAGFFYVLSEAKIPRWHYEHNIKMGRGAGTEILVSWGYIFSGKGYFIGRGKNFSVGDLPIFLSM